MPTGMRDVGMKVEGQEKHLLPGTLVVVPSKPICFSPFLDSLSIYSSRWEWDAIL